MEGGNLQRRTGRCDDLHRPPAAFAPCLDLASDGIAVIALVRMQDACACQPLQKHGAGGAISHLAAGRQERDRATQLVRQGMDFGGAPAARAADRLTVLPPFPPEAERCAFTAEESIITCAGGPPA